ncbi:hypothetical protein D3C81_1385650 [compost metagenome]
MLRRFVVLLCLPLLLSACGDEEKAAPPASPAAAPQIAVPVVQPAPAPVAKPEPAPAAQPSAKSETPPAKATATADAPRKPVKKPEKMVAKHPEPQAPVDLHLPSDLLLASAAVAPTEAEKSLLPPMFVEKPSQAAFQLNGKLLHKEHAREDDYWQTVEGAELQFEFKH